MPNVKVRPRQDWNASSLEANAENFLSFFCVLDPTENLLFGMELTWIVLITVCSLLIIFACLVGVAICLCRRSPINNNINGSSQHNNGNGNFNQVPREFVVKTLSQALVALKCQDLPLLPSSLIDSSISLLKFIKRASTQQTGQSTRPCLVIRRHACPPRTESTAITRFPGTSICAWKRRQSMGPPAILSQWWVKTCYHKTTRPPRTSGLCKGWKRVRSPGKAPRNFDQRELSRVSM